MAILKKQNYTALILALAGVFAAAGLAIGYKISFSKPGNPRGTKPSTDLRAGGGLSLTPTSVLAALRAARYHAASSKESLPGRTWPRIHWDANKRIEHRWQLDEWAKPLPRRKNFLTGSGGVDYSPPRHYPQRNSGYALQPTIPSAPGIGDSSPNLGSPIYWIYTGPVGTTGNSSGGKTDNTPSGGSGSIPGSGTDKGNSATKPTPVPGSVWLMGSGLAILVWMRRK